MILPNEWMKFAPEPLPLNQEDKWNVFLSYRSVNRRWVLNLYDILRELGHKVFLDQCALKIGDVLIRELQNALSASQAGILIWSKDSRDSEWVQREYEVMEAQVDEKKGFRFIPVILDETKLPLFAKRRIFLDFSSYPDGPNGGELLRLLYALAGKPLSQEAAHFASEQDEAALVATTRIKAAMKNKYSDRILQLFNEGGITWETSAALGCLAAESLTKLDRNDDAIMLLEKVEQCFPKAIRPKQLRALALARRGMKNDLKIAQDILGELYESGERDPETIGIYARTWMDRYENSNDINDLKQSRDYYAEAFKNAQDDYYTGINAAAKSVFIGTEVDLQLAAGYAQQVQQIVGTEPHPEDYWMTATVGEVLLIQKKYDEAGKIYEAAVAMARSEDGSHKTTWKQACRLMRKLKTTEEERTKIRKAFEHLPDCNQL